jgi:hypothetical protein
MPGVASWNGKWTGSDKQYFVIRKSSKTWLSKQEHFKTLLEKGEDSFYYRWDDGWAANVTVKIIDGPEARKRRKASAGFAGYDWMVNSIMYKGKITTESVAV